MSISEYLLRDHSQTPFSVRQNNEFHPNEQREGICPEPNKRTGLAMENLSHSRNYPWLPNTKIPKAELQHQERGFDQLPSKLNTDRQGGYRTRKTLATKD